MKAGINDMILIEAEVGLTRTDKEICMKRGERYADESCFPY